MEGSVKKALALSCSPRIEEIDWLKRCAIEEVKSFSHIDQLPNFLIDAGFMNCSVRYLGGLRVLVECASVETLNKLTSGDINWLEDWFTNLSPWTLDQEQVRPRRVVWLNISGVPLHVWHGETFQRIASL